MIAYPELQSSGNNWAPPAPATLNAHDVQAFSSQPVPRGQNSIFEALEKQMAEAAAEHEAVLAEVRKHFVLPSDSSVEAFLFERRTTSQLLLEAVTHIKTFFGGDTILTLRAPLDESGSRTLYAVVMWQGRIEDVRAALGNFDESWWLSRSRQALGYLTFTYELV